MRLYDYWSCTYMHTIYVDEYLFVVDDIKKVYEICDAQKNLKNASSRFRNKLI